MFKPQIILSAAAVVVSLAMAVAAEQTDFNLGQAAGAELKLGLGARPVAMGQAFVALADDVNATAWNPAGLAQVPGIQIGFMHNLYLQSTSLEYLAYAQNICEGGGIGANVTYLNYGTLDKIDDSAQVVGNFAPVAYTAAIGYGQRIWPGFSLGAAVKFIRQQIDTETYSAVAADLGLLVSPGLKELQLGLAVQNLGTQLAGFDLPRNAKVGAAYLLPVRTAEKDAWHLLADLNVPFVDTASTTLNLGTEYTINQTLSLRGGYQLKNTNNLGGTTGLTAGAGFRFSVIQLDYALLSFGDLGLTQQFAVGVNF